MKFTSPTAVAAQIAQFEERLGTLPHLQGATAGGHASGSARQQRRRDEEIRTHYLQRKGDYGVVNEIAAAFGLSERQVRRILRIGGVKRDTVADIPSRDPPAGRYSDLPSKLGSVASRSADRGIGTASRAANSAEPESTQSFVIPNESPLLQIPSSGSNLVSETWSSGGCRLKGALTMKFRAFVAGALVIFLVGAMPDRTLAGEIDTQVGAFSDGGTFEYVLGLATSSDTSDKAAALLIRGPDPSKEEYKRHAAFFSDRHQWGQFAALWDLARHTRPPKRTNINGNSIHIGKYFDNAAQALVSVSVNDDATIEFDLVDPDKWPMLFRLQPKDFKEFDRDVKKVSAYFGT